MQEQQNLIRIHKRLRLEKHEQQSDWMKIAIIGLGFVGLSLTSVLASKGFNVVGIDVDKEKCRNISNGVLPFFEPNLEKTLKKGLKNKLQIESDVSVVQDCDLIFVTVGTPQNKTGAIERQIRFFAHLELYLSG